METIYTNCDIVTPEEVFKGAVVVRDGYIKEIADSPYRGSGAIDLEGDYLLPGLIEMHTDNLEKNIQPRPGVIWPSIMSATLAHDTQITGAGITTVYDAVAVGALRDGDMRIKILKDSVDAVCTASQKRLLKADHFIHLRCEVADSRMADILEALADCPRTRLVSIMDHTPGQRQWRDIEKWRQYHRDKRWSEQEVKNILANLREMQGIYARKHRKIVTDFARRNHLPLASHDDTTAQDAITAAADGVLISEFPTTVEAAAKANELGIKTIMGAPNALRGVSHSGNISARTLAENKLLDGLSSDYVPNSLLHSSFHLSETLQIPLNRSVAMVSANIATMVGLHDRGAIACDKKADLLQVQLVDKLPVVRKVWRKGGQVA